VHHVQFSQAYLGEKKSLDMLDLELRLAELTGHTGAHLLLGAGSMMGVLDTYDVVRRYHADSQVTVDIEQVDNVTGKPPLPDVPRQRMRVRLGGVFRSLSQRTFRPRLLNGIAYANRSRYAARVYAAHQQKLRPLSSSVPQHLSEREYPGVGAGRRCG
jgi:hypothetical protein